MTMAICERFASCDFFRRYKYDMEQRQYEFWLANYCEGKLQSQCKRLKWLTEKSETPPDSLLPTGCLIGSEAIFYE